MTRKRYAVVGIGGRSQMYLKALTDKYESSCELVAICDRNPGRMSHLCSELAEGYQRLPQYDDATFDRMLKAEKPDAVIVTTMDRFHDHYIVKALDAGCDAITEKPMTIDAKRCRRILDAVERTGRQVQVTFNYRYAPPRSQVKRLLMDGVIGQILSVDFHWMLDTSHGADYFRRWHRSKQNSGGLMVHKATHHFDLVNWWLGTVPVEVYAQGKRAFYTPDTARRYGLEGHGERCRDCSVTDRCKFFLDLASTSKWRGLYLDQEKYDGYFRDRCVWGEEIDIEDTMAVNVRYKSGVLMSYSLNAFAPWEGYVIAFNGTKGRLEHKTVESTYVSGDGRVPGETDTDASYIRVFPHFETPYDVTLDTGKGGHGGGDHRLLDDLLSPNPPVDPLKRSADHRAGAYSILTGVAANRSMATGGETVRVAELAGPIPEPDYPTMIE